MTNKAAVLFISGQSNAHAHEQFLNEDDCINVPLRNVYSLDRNPNQSYEIEDIEWSGFTTQGKNLGESQDNTASFSYYIAKLWQAAIDSGENLPDLYIVQMSIGCQGIVNGMWNKDREKLMIPGPLGIVKISLFPLAMHINRLVIKNLKESGKEPVVIGWHWIGSEQDIHYDAYKRLDIRERYNFFFDSFMSSIGEECPLYLYKIACKKYCLQNNVPTEAVDAVNEELLHQASRRKIAKVVDVKNCPLWDDNHENNGVYAADNAHYLAQVQAWFAKSFFADIHQILF